jgi:hypothetical protein
MKTSIFLSVCAGVVLYATWEMPMFLMATYPLVTVSAVLAGLVLIAVGLIRGERLTVESVRNVIPLIIAGLVSLLLVTLLRGTKNFSFVIAAGTVCLGASVALVALEKPRRFVAAGVQVILLLYIWGLTPYWIMGVSNNWL